MSKNGRNDAAVTNRGNYLGENEHLYRLIPSHLPSKTTDYSRKFGFSHQDIMNEHRRQIGYRKNLKWARVIWSLSSATIK